MNTQRVRGLLVALAFFLPLAAMVFLVSHNLKKQKQAAAAFKSRVESVFSKWETENAGRMLAVADLDIKSALTNISTTIDLSSTQNKKLLEAIEGFFRCYAVGTFEAFASYRLTLPYELDTNVMSDLRFCLPPNYRPSGDKLDELKMFWRYYVSTNRIVRINPASVKIHIGVITNRSQAIYARATNYIAEAAVGSLPRLVVVHPTAREIFRRDRKVVNATVEQFIVSSANPASVDPLFVSFYWVEELGQWLPYEVGRITGDFRILF